MNTKMQVIHIWVHQDTFCITTSSTLLHRYFPNYKPKCWAGAQIKVLSHLAFSWCGVSEVFGLVENSVTQFVDDVVQQEADVVEDIILETDSIARSIVDAGQVEAYVEDVVSQASAQIVDDQEEGPLITWYFTWRHSNIFISLLLLF